MATTQTTRTPLYASLHNLLRFLRLRRSKPPGLYHLLRFGSNDSLTLEEATGGILILGVTGAGKTTSSASHIAKGLLARDRSGLARDCGGLILAAKPEEVARWIAAIYSAGRESDLVLFAGHKHQFNFLQWGKDSGYGVEDLVHLFTQAVEAVGRQRGTHALEDSSYWVTAMETLVRNTIMLITLAQETISLYDLHRLILEAPEKGDPEKNSWKEHSFCYQSIERARQRAAQPNNPLLRHYVTMLEQYWLHSYANLNPRTKTSITNMFTSVTSPLLQGELFPYFCSGVTMSPTWAHQGKLILMDIPSEISEAALYAQILMKACYQMATRRRQVSPHDPVSFLYVDEAELFSTSSDIIFQGVTRERRAITVYVGHSLPEFYAKMGQTQADALVGHFRNKIFHAAGDVTTATYAARLIGETWQDYVTTSESESNTYTSVLHWFFNNFMARWFGFSYSLSTTRAVSLSTRFAYQVSPAEFTTLRTGGRANGFLVDAILFTSGKIWSTGANHLRVTFQQNLPQ